MDIATVSTQLSPIIIQQTDPLAGVQLIVNLLSLFSTIFLALIGYLVFMSNKQKNEAQKYLNDIKEIRKEFMSYSKESLKLIKSQLSLSQEVSSEYSQLLKENELKMIKANAAYDMAVDNFKKIISSLRFITKEKRKKLEELLEKTKIT